MKRSKKSLVDTADIDPTYRQRGTILTPFGKIHATEQKQKGAYILKPSILIDGLGQQIRWSDELAKRVTKSHPSDIEYILDDLDQYIVLSPEHWVGWDPLEKKDGHISIYKHIMETIDRYNLFGRFCVVGCGTGSFLDELVRRGIEAFGIDPCEENVQIGLGQGRSIKKATILDLHGTYDVILDPGVLSAGVVTPDYIPLALSHLNDSLNPGGVLIHAPISRSLITSKDLRKLNLDVLVKSVPKHLFTYHQLKQFYVCQKYS